ncbi:MAG: deoxyguanosinetriphosphate triphosphohydrolase [Gammaproteobacteria bacterium]|nr:MAG: deoxyguanosinetriphosphate triphosphohydrolase [Gammaproteobacteria bacterium]
MPVQRVNPGEGLAPWAAWESLSRGRRHPEPAHPYRGEFQRDRDRIIHSTAFRRLVYKTQVFVNHEGDHYRTRLTHSLEVAQIARTVALRLGLNECLVEAICLAHDLGHTPFGHAGQDALNACMEPFGGFEHNLQSLRVVDELEDKYAAFRGLNLTFETREGILKHCSRRNARELGELGERFLERRQPSLEAQLANLADEIAYNNHDVDDGLRAGLLTEDELDAVELFRERHEAVRRASPQISRRALIHEIVRGMINEVVTDLIDSSEAALEKAHPTDIEAVRRQKQPLIRFSRRTAGRHRKLKAFLQKSLYRHERVLLMTERAAGIVTALFQRYMDDPHAMPREHAQRALDWGEAQGDRGRARAVADYVAGMTDRYALAEYRRLVAEPPEMEMQAKATETNDD